MDVVSCDNSACSYWKDDYLCLTDKSAHCPVYKGQEMLDGYCSDFKSSNKEYLVQPTASPKP